MKNNNLKRLLLGGAILSLVFAVALPASATNNGSDKDKVKFMQLGQAKKISQLEASAQARIAKDRDKANDDILRIGGQAFNNAFRAARDAFNKEMKDAKKVYQQEKKSANDVLRAAIKSAGNNQDAMTAAFNNYRNSLASSLEKMSKAQQAAFNKFIAALRNLSFTPTPNVNDVPIANAVSVKTNANTAVSMTLVGSDADGCSAQNFTYSIETPANGFVSTTSGNATCVDGKITFGVTYTPKQNFAGNDSFRFRFSDGNLSSSMATVSVVVVSPSADTAN